MGISEKLAGYLLQSKSIIIDPANPFQWSSGWKSPIYCDNRKTLVYPEIRSFIKIHLAGQIKKHFGKPDIIAGVATGAIAHGALVAEHLNLPFVYIRPSPKTHGLENQIEGDVSVGNTAVVVEDLISTGGSSLRAVNALRQSDIKVSGMVAIFTYSFPIAIKNFKEANVKLVALTNYPTLIRQATEMNIISPELLDTLKEWRENPDNWEPLKK